MNMRQMRPIKILIVDDEKSFTSAVKEYFEGTANCRVREENEGNRAVSSARNFMPDVILLDINMPDLSGGEVAAQLRNDPSLKDIPIIFVTALIRKYEETAIGDQRYIAKPVRMRELMERVEKKLPRHTPMNRTGSSAGIMMKRPYQKRLTRRMYW